MNRRHERAIGATLMAGALLGLLLSVLGLGLLWWSEGRINSRVESAAATGRQTLEATDDLLVAADDTLVRVLAQLEAVEAALESTARTTRDIGALAGGDAARVIGNTRTALLSASTTAGIVDSTLRVISELPFVGGTRYRPEVPLAESFASVAESLAPLPAQLAEAERNLDLTADSVESIREQLAGVTGDVAGADASLATARASVAAYRTTVADLERAAARVEDDFASALRWFNTFATLLLLWLMVAQVGLLTQGYEWWRRGSAPEA